MPRRASISQKTLILAEEKRKIKDRQYRRYDSTVAADKIGASVMKSETQQELDEERRIQH